MQPVEFQFQLLARALKTENQAMISAYIKVFTSLQFPSPDIVDKCNLPLLMLPHVEKNPEVKNFLEKHAFIKSQIHEKQKSVILETFENGLKRKIGGANVPFERVMLLTMMLEMEDPEYVRLGYKLFNELNFEPFHYVVAVGLARQASHLYPEAESLIRKVELLFRSMDPVDEDMHMDPEEEDDENDDVVVELEFENHFDEGAILNESFRSEDSGFEGENEEMLDDEMRIAFEGDIRFEMAYGEVLLKNLAECLKNQDSDRIAMALDALGNWQLPLFMYRRHEISRLIYENKVYRGYWLYSGIERTGEVEYQNDKEEVFRRILEYVDCFGDTISEELMTLLMTYWKPEDDLYNVPTVAKTLLSKNVSLYLCEKFNIKFRIQETPWDLPELTELGEKIDEMIRVRDEMQAC